MDSVFEKMISDFRSQDGEYLLERCMNRPQKELKRIPLRYRLIAYGFVKGLSLEELNEKLTAQHCEKLYARNFLEASLVFAFSKKLSYERWKELWHTCCQSVLPEEDDLLSGHQNISLALLREYVAKNSEMNQNGFATRHLTHYLEQDIQNLSDDEEQFRSFLKYNIACFSQVREKARYYFCKYLYYYVSEKVDRYLKAPEGQEKELALSDLLILKGVTALSRKKMTGEEARKFLEHVAISCGNIYDAFNYYYFGYVSSDWMEVLLDYYGGNITLLPAEQKKKLAGSIRIYHPQWKRLGDEEVIGKKWKEMQETEEELDRIYARDNQVHGYQRNRSGEKSVRNYIKGKVDIDRTTLICYLIFFGSGITVEKRQEICVDRINEILRECGFPMLRDQDEFDRFIIQYMNSKEPVDYLMESVTSCAFQNRNFFLYHMYNESVNNKEQFEKLLRTDNRR